MNILAEDHISEPRDFANEFVLFPAGFGCEKWGEEPASRLSRAELDAFLNAVSANARSAHFFIPAPEHPRPTPEKGLAAGVLKQAAYDLRRFYSATKGVKRELYRDAYSWITSDDFQHHARIRRERSAAILDKRVRIYFERARQLLPNSSRIPQSLAYVERRRGNWEKSEA